MGFSLNPLSAIQAAFTKPGQNAANQQQARQGDFAKGAGALGTSLFPWAQKQTDYAASLEPQRQQAFGSLINSFSPQADAAAAGKMKNQLFSNNARALAQSGPAMAGYGAGLQGGNALALSNANASGANQIDQQFGSPQYHQDQMARLLQYLQQAQSAPALQNLSQIGGLVYGQPQVQVGAGLGDYLGQALGMAAGGGAFGGGGNPLGNRGMSGLSAFGAGFG